MAIPAVLAFPDPAPADELIALRPWRADEGDAVATAVRDPVLRRFRASHPRSDAEARAWLHAALRPTPDRLELAIADADDDTMLGSISLRQLDRRHHSATISYWVAAPVRGRGVATHALGLLSRWCLNELGVERLQLFVDVENIASQGVARRCRYVREGVLRSHLRHGDERHDSVLFSLLPSDLT